MAAYIGHYERIRALAATPKLVLTGGVQVSTATEVVAFDHQANKLAFFYALPAAAHALLVVGEQVLSACGDGALRGHSLSDGKETLAVAGAHAGGCIALAASPKGDRVATVGADGALRLWALPGGKKLAQYELSGMPLRAVAWDPSSDLLAAAGDDGIVRVVNSSTGSVREMRGHEGPVFALAFTPTDGRVCSAGDDGLVRLWYVTGDVEFETRGGGEDGHKGAIHALAFLPWPEPPAGQEPVVRFVTAGADGQLKLWHLESKRKPRTLDGGNKPLYALAFANPANASAARNSLGSLFTGGDRRSVLAFRLDAAGDAQSSPTVYGHAFDTIALNLAQAPRPAREQTVNWLAETEEPEAQELLLKALSSDREAEVRAKAASELGRKLRRWGRAGLRGALSDASGLVRKEAFGALRAIDGPTSLSPVRAALASTVAEMRIEALRALLPLRELSPLVPGLLADKLTDREATVRKAALEELSKLHPPGSVEPLRIAYERGPVDLKVEVLIRAAMLGCISAPVMNSLVARALDEEDANVRRTAFAVRVLERTALVALLEKGDEDLQRALREIATRVAWVLRERKGPPEGKPTNPSDEELAAARAQLPGKGEAGASLSTEDLEPLLSALACRAPDTALRGARGLALVGDGRALGALLQLSREVDPKLRREAAQALQQLHDPRAKKRLLWMFDDGDAAVRAAAFESYTKLEGDRTLRIADNALRSAHEDLRVRGLELLVKLGGAAGGPGSEAEALLGDAIEDEAGKVRSEAFRTLWAWHSKDPVKALDRALEARFPDVRMRAVEELKTLGKESWALERLERCIGDRDAGVAQAAYDGLVKLSGEKRDATHAAALASVHASVREAGAKGAAHGSLEGLRAPLTKLLQDEAPGVRSRALETLDKLLPNEAGPHYASLQSGFVDLKVYAAELLASRRDEQLIEPMRSLLVDKELERKLPADALKRFRARAATALATLGATRLVKYFATELVKDEQSEVREQASRGLATAARKGDEGFLLDLLGHQEIWVRSWAADGLSRLGDPRAVPVLTGTLRHEHLPIRFAAIVSFAALGPEGYGGMLQGLEDPTREVQEMVFAIVLARDLRAFRRGEPPELLTSALSSGRPEVRFAAARALELRSDPEDYLAHVVEVLMPPEPEKASDKKGWPGAEQLGRLLVSLAEALAGEQPARRYAAAMALRNKNNKPLVYFQEVARATKLASVGAPVAPDTAPVPLETTPEAEAKPRRGWLRRLFAEGVEGSDEKAKKHAGEVSESERGHLQYLAFGAYVGLLRQVSSGDDEGHRVRRDAIDRIVDLGRHSPIGAGAAIPALVRALDDPHYLVRKAALAGLKKVYPQGAEEPLTFAFTSVSADVAKAALDELGERGDSARPRIAAALNASLAEVRKYAFELLERLAPKGSLEPLLAALASDYADVRLGVVERLAVANDTRVTEALRRAMESDHEDLRLRAAELLSQRGDELTVDVLAGFLRSDTRAHFDRALRCLERLGTPRAVAALSARFEEATDADREQLARSLGATRSREAVDVLAARLEDDAHNVRSEALTQGLGIAAHHGAEALRAQKKKLPEEQDGREGRDAVLALVVLRPAARSKDPALRLTAAQELRFGDDGAVDELLLGLVRDRELAVRVAAAASYSHRVKHRGAAVGPMREVVQRGTRELLLSASEAVAHTGDTLALRPLLLVARAGEPAERSAAVLALGTLGDARALQELETVANGGTEEAPVTPEMQAAAFEALGRIVGKLTDEEARKRVLERVERTVSEQGDWAQRLASVRGLRWVGGERARLKLEALALANHEHSSLRTAAIEQLAILGDRASEGMLAQALDAQDYAVRPAARKALEKLFPEDRVRVELLAVDSRFDDVSGPATQYLAEEGDPEQLVPRLATLKTVALRERLRFGMLRRRVLPVEALLKLLSQEAPVAREEAAWLLGAATEVPKDSAERIAAGLLAAERSTAGQWRQRKLSERGEAENAWVRLLWALAARGVGGAVENARAVLEGGDTSAPGRVRTEAARLLGKLGSAKDEAVLARALLDVDAQVRQATAGALARLAPARALGLAAAVRPFDPVAFAVTAGGEGSAAALESDEGRRLVLPSLLTRGELSGLLELARSAKDALTRQDAVEALARSASPEAATLLKQLAGDKKGVETALRKAAWRAYKRIERRMVREKKYEARA